jgi:hypothetical protein
VHILGGLELPSSPNRPKIYPKIEAKKGLFFHQFWIRIYPKILILGGPPKRMSMFFCFNVRFWFRFLRFLWFSIYVILLFLGKLNFCLFLMILLVVFFSCTAISICDRYLRRCCSNFPFKMDPMQEQNMDIRLRGPPKINILPTWGFRGPSGSFSA